MLRTLLLTGVLLAGHAVADCASWGLKVWPPPGTVLPPNARLLIEGFGRAQPMVAKLAASNPRLVAKSADSLTFSPPVRLKVVALHQGEMELTQAVLQPEKPLFPGTQYTLTFDGLTIEDPMFAPKEPLRWSVAGEPDRAAPAWLTPPTAGRGNYKEMGCGPVEEARVQLAVKDESPYLVLARVQGATGGVREYLLRPKDDGELMVGHSMCLGAFRLGDGAWTLELLAVDAAGNTTPAPGAPLRFKGLDPVK